MKKDKKEKAFVSKIGGQAMLEGVMMRSPKSTAVAVRDFRGDLVVYSERNEKPSKRINKVPIVRGFISFITSLISGFRYTIKSIEPLGDEDEQLTGGQMMFSVALGVLFAIALFAVLPKLVNWLLFDIALSLSDIFADSYYIYVLITSAVSGVIRVIVLVLYMWIISRMKSIYRMYQYHGAEHRTINCYESRLPLTVENVQSCSTKHSRCGTTFLFYTVMVSIIMTVIVAFVLSLMGVTALSVTEFTGSSALGTLLYSLILIGSNLLVFPITSGISYEFLRLVARAPDNWLVSLLRAPGFALQKLSTKIPDDSMAEAAILAFNTVSKLDSDENYPTGDFYEFSISDIKRVIAKKYATAGIDEESEIDWLLSEALNVRRSELIGDTVLTKEQGNTALEWATKRTEGIPLEYVTGNGYLYGNRLTVNKDVLVPRMDSETVVRCALKLIGEEPYTVLDLMTGSGCIALAIVKSSNAKVTASDVSDAALTVARQNLPENVEVIKSDVFSSITGKFDMIISNPPYIKSSDISGLQKEVQTQPHIALDGGSDGLKFYRIIAEQASGHLNNNGYLVLEIGSDQANEVSALLKDNFTEISVYKDLDGNDRAITARVKR